MLLYHSIQHALSMSRRHRYTMCDSYQAPHRKEHDSLCTRTTPTISVPSSLYKSTQPTISVPKSPDYIRTKSSRSISLQYPNEYTTKGTDQNEVLSVGLKIYTTLDRRLTMQSLPGIFCASSDTAEGNRGPYEHLVKTPRRCKKKNRIFTLPACQGLLSYDFRTDIHI